MLQFVCLGKIFLEFHIITDSFTFNLRVCNLFLFVIIIIKQPFFLCNFLFGKFIVLKIKHSGNYIPSSLGDFFFIIQSVMGYAIYF